MGTLMENLVNYQTAFRLGCFFAVLLALALGERRWPRRAAPMPRRRRWPANLGIVAVDSLAVRLAVPLLAVAAAQQAEQRGWGLCHWLQLPPWLSGIVSLLVLDLAIYTQHLLFHKIPLLWRLHRLHHSDTAIDVSTALRFHPLEIILSMYFKIVIVLLLGAPATAVVLFEIILNATALFNHANLRLPETVDRVLRLFLVTPDMHRVHHSIRREETDSNFGFNLPWWDHLFGTYRPQPQDGHTRMTIGLDSFRDQRSRSLYWLLLQPFLRADTPPSA